jgi:hypothetical protein
MKFLLLLLTIIAGISVVTPGAPLNRVVFDANGNLAR